jgi:hypothetical protein
MAGEVGLLECPMCDFTVLPADDYILQLHFEQVHTTDSPFIIQDDPEPPLPTQTKRPAPDAEDTPSSDDEEDSTVTCPDPDCGELVPLIDFNDHLDFHGAESLSFDETTGKYRSHHSSATMQTLAAHPRTAFSKSSFADYNSTISSPEASNKQDERGHKLRKRSHRHRSDTNSSEKSTLSRSMLTFNPFAKSDDKAVKPPNKSARLGASLLCIFHFLAS